MACAEKNLEQDEEGRGGEAPGILRSDDSERRFRRREETGDMQKKEREKVERKRISNYGPLFQKGKPLPSRMFDLDS